MSFSHSPSSSSSSQQVHSPQITPLIPENLSPNLAKRIQQSICFTCKQQGHWSWHCPSKSLKSPQKNTTAASSNTTTIQCPCGHGYCEIKSRFGRNYYACPIKRGVKCKDVVKWCDQAIHERDLQPPPFKYPECQCRAGVCRRVKGADSNYYFTCLIKQGHGSCGYFVSEDEIVKLQMLNRKDTVPVIQQSKQRTHDEFWEGCLNDELGKGDGLHVQIKRMRITDSPEMIPDKEDAGDSKHNGFPDFVVDDDDIEFINSVSWESVEAEAFLLSSHLSTSSRIRWQQVMSQKGIFSDVSFGSCPMGWLGRLLFFYPTKSLKFPTPQPFFCCIFPSYNPIIVPKQKTSIPDGPVECNQIVISSVDQCTQLSTGSHTEVSGDVVGPRKSQDGERKAKRHREVVLFIQQQLLVDLETLAPHEFESMREAAEDTFELLNAIGVDYEQFSDHVLDYISFASSIAEMDKSMENYSLSMDERIKLFEEEKARFAQLQDNYVTTKALLEASNRHRQLLCEQVSNLKAMLNEKQYQLKCCVLEILKIETHLGDLKRNILESDITLKERAEQTEVARKQSEERQAKQIAAKEALAKAKLELEN